MLLALLSMEGSRSRFALFSRPESRNVDVFTNDQSASLPSFFFIL